MKNDICIRAIYLPDLTLIQEKDNRLCVFQYNHKIKKFQMIGHNDFTYDVDQLINDDDWIIYKIWTDSDEYNDIEYGEYEKINNCKLKDVINFIFNK